MFGTKKFAASADDSGAVVVKVGGGFQSLPQFINNFKDSELKKSKTYSSEELENIYDENFEWAKSKK